MNDVESLERFAKFRAANVATDVSDIDPGFAYSEGSTDPYILGQLARLLSISPLMEMGIVGSHWAGASAAIEGSEPAPDEAPLSNFDFLDEPRTLNELRTPKGQIQDQIRALRSDGGLSYHERLARRLDLLLVAAEEEEAWAEGSPDSLRQLLLFLQATPDLRCPTVTITPSMTFRAQWQAGLDRHLAVDFLPDGQVRFVVFSPDQHYRGRVQRVSGIVSRGDVMRVIEPYGVHRWAVDAGA
jgi:hypothetical protein